MEPSAQVNEKRRYYRLQPNVEQKPRATFNIDEKTVDVNLVNFSPGGLLCYIEHTSFLFETGTIIPRIEIKLQNKPPIEYSGKILRIQTTEKEQCFCAVEFIKFDQKYLKKDRRLPPDKRHINTNSEYLERLESLGNFLRASSLNEEFQIRERVYDAFTVEAKRLPIEERWYFFEVIDEMKRCEPDYPQGLKQEFLFLCQAENHCEFQPKNNQQSNRFSYFIKKLFRK